MAIKIKAMDGPARICEISIKQNKVITPNIFFLNTSRFKKPDSADFLLTKKTKTFKKNQIEIKNIQKENPRNNINIEIPELNDYNSQYQVVNFDDDIEKIRINKKENIFFIIENSLNISKKQTDFVNFIIKLRKTIGYNNLLYLPTIGNISNLSLFTYMGIDLIDSISAIISARKKELFFLSGNQNINEIRQIPCSCKYCKKYIDNPLLMPFENILKHNYEILLNEIKSIKNHLLNGSLRNLVEIRVKSDVNSTTLLRILDDKHYKYIEENTPLISKKKLIVTTKEAFNRAEIRRFQERIIGNYKKPSSTKILLILPCSAKKPYSFSKSHKKIRENLFNLENPNIIHELIITSPLGLVPRDLELIYPASNYDIPVTGIWDNEEKKIITDLLKKYLIKNKYDKIILHLPKNIIQFISETVKNPIKTEVVGNVTSKISLKSLYNVLDKECKKYPRIKSEKRKIENIESILSYQFNKNIAKAFIKDCEIKGRYPYQKIFNKNLQLGMQTKERGLITITIEGAKRIFNSNKYFIEIFDDFLLKGSLLVPGIKNADKDIRIGDEVFIIKNKKLYAIGVAKMNGKKMMELNYGEAASIRHKV